MWLFQLSTVSYNKVSNYLIHLQKSANEISYKAAKQPHRNGHYTHSFEGHGERTAHYGFPFTAMPILHAYNWGRCAAVWRDAFVKRDVKTEGACTGPIRGPVRASVYLFLFFPTNYYLFRRFLKIRDSPRGSEYPKTANFGFILPRFWHKKTRELSLVYS